MLLYMIIIYKVSISLTLVLLIYLSNSNNLGIFNALQHGV